MRRIAIILLLAAGAAFRTGASEPAIKADLSAAGEYSYNAALGSAAGLNISSLIVFGQNCNSTACAPDCAGTYPAGCICNAKELPRPCGPAFELEPTLQLCTAGIHTAALQARTVFPLGRGRSELFLGERILFRDVAALGMFDAALGLSMGWRCPWFEAEAGMFSRYLGEFGRDIHSEDETLCEPFNLLFKFKGYVRPASSNWNIYGSISDFDTFQVERMWQFIFTAGGWYSLNDSLTLRAEAVLKPTGMFHLNAEFYYLALRLGVTYSF